MDALLTQRELVVLRTLHELGDRATHTQIFDEVGIRQQLTSYKLGNMLDGLFRSGHVLKEWPNWFKLTDKGRKAIGLKDES